MQTKKKILVIGSQGYIGATLTDYLLKKDYNLIGVDNFIYNQKKVNFSNRNYKFINCDLRDKKKIYKLLSKVSHVVILAGLVGDPITKKYQKLAHDINYKGIKNVIKICNKSKIKKLIFISTCSNYGVTKGDKLLNEKHALRPISLYAKQKVKIEKFLLKNKFKFSITVLRFATAFGLSPRMRFDLTLNEFIKDAFFKKQLDIYEPNTFRPYCHIIDFCRIINLVLKKKSNDLDKEVFNCGSNNNNYSKIQIARILKKRFKDLKIVINKNVKDKRNYRVDFSKIKKLLKFRSKYNVNYGVSEIINFLKKNKNSKLYKDVNNKKFGNYLINKFY
jgi:nucleoside-diphosphate-sugar epimerase